MQSENELSGVRFVFSRYDLCEKGYEAPENEVNIPTSAVPEEDLQHREPQLLLCDSCRRELHLFPLNT